MAMERTNNESITYEIVEHLAVIAAEKNGWSKELNLVSWNGQQPPKFDIREWSADHTRMKKGITLFDPEMRKVSQAYFKFCNARKVSEGRYNRNAAAEAGMRAGEEAAHALEDTEGESVHTREEAEKDAARFHGEENRNAAEAGAEISAAAAASDTQAFAGTEEAQPF